jgi:predicted nucleic acid-binding protein
MKNPYLSRRDALIIANFLSNKVSTIYTHNQELSKPAKKSHGKTST